jgi:hypothetical protein
VTVAYGGYIFNRVPDIRRRIPGHFLGTELNQVPQIVEQLLTTRPPLPTAVPPDPEYQQAVAYFRERAGLLHSHIWQGIHEAGIPRSTLSVADDYLTRSIIAALRLGDLDYINADLNWVEGLIINYDIPAEHLSRYMAIYATAAEQLLTAPAGQLIVEWLATMAKQIGRTRSFTTKSASHASP